MSSFTVAFTAVGAGNSISVMPGDSLDWVVSGSFSATLHLQRSTDNFASFVTVVTKNAADSGTVYAPVETNNSVQFRWACIAYGSGTATCTISDAEATANILANDSGEAIATVRESSFRVEKDFYVSGNSSLSGTLDLGAALNTAPSANIASATTTNLDNASGNYVDITGTTTITGITLSQGRFRIVRFNGALTLTHSSSLVLPTSANIVTAAGDHAIFVSNLGGTAVRCTHYERASGIPLAFTRTSQSFFMPAGIRTKAGATAGWVVGAADNINVSTLPASQTSSTLVIPVSGLKIGWTITSYSLLGQIESAGGSVTLNAQLHRLDAVAADITDTNLGSMTPLTVTADTVVDVNNANRTIASNNAVDAISSHFILVTGTTAAATDIALMGAYVTCTTD